MSSGCQILFCLQYGLMGPEGRLIAVDGQKDIKIRLRKTEYKDGPGEPELFKIIISFWHMPVEMNAREMSMMKLAFFIGAPIEFKITDHGKDRYGTQTGHIFYFDETSPVNGTVEYKFLIQGKLNRNREDEKNGKL